MELIKSNYNIIATILFVLIIIVAHIFAVNNYDWTKNTISDLGAQGYTRKLIMQIGFLVFGLCLSIGVCLNNLAWRTIPILVYGLSVALTGVFCTKPFFNTISYSTKQSTLHSVFAQIAGITFCVGIIIQFLSTSNRNLKLVHILFLTLVIALSATFGLLKNFQGVVQRILYFISFIWLIKYYKP